MAENITGMKRTHRCAEVTAEDVGEGNCRDGLGA